MADYKMMGLDPATGRLMVTAMVLGASSGILDLPGALNLGGALGMAGYDIVNPGDVDGVDVSAHAAGTAASQHSGGIGAHDHQSAAAGDLIDHGAAITALSLLDDDHTQYALLAGRSGGQTMIGGSAAGEDLHFQTTSDATKGTYFFDELTNGFMKIAGGSGGVSISSSVSLTTEVSGLLPVGNGGTGLDSSGVTDGQLLIGSDVGNGFVLATLSGTANEINITNGAGTITIGIPSSPVFGGAPTISDFTNMGHDHSDVANGNTIGHAVLTGLAADDHTQYALLAGRAGGQTLIGGTGAGDDIHLQTTSDGTKGSYFLDELTTNGFVKTGGANGELSVSASVALGSDVSGVLPVANGGTGQNWSAGAQYSLPYFTGVGTMGLLGPGSPGQVVGISGGGVLSYLNVVAGVSSVTAGTGLTGGGTGAVTINIPSTLSCGLDIQADSIAINPDGSTLEVTAATPGVLQVKTNGITPLQLKNDPTGAAGINSSDIAQDSNWSPTNFTVSAVYTDKDGNKSATDVFAAIDAWATGVTSNIRFVANVFTALGPVLDGTDGLRASVAFKISVNPSDGNAFIISDGTTDESFTFKTTPAGGNDIQIGADLETSVQNAVTLINSNSALTSSEWTINDVLDATGLAVILLGAEDNVGPYEIYTTAAWASQPEYANDPTDLDWTSLPTSSPGATNWTPVISEANLNTGDTVVIAFGTRRDSWWTFDDTDNTWTQTKGETPVLTYDQGVKRVTTEGLPYKIRADLQTNGGLKLVGDSIAFQDGGTLSVDGATGDVDVNTGAAFSWTGAHTFSNTVGGGGVGTMNLSTFGTVNIGTFTTGAGNTMTPTDFAAGLAAWPYAEITAFEGGMGADDADLGSVLYHSGASTFALASANETSAEALAGICLVAATSGNPTVVTKGCLVNALFVAGLTVAVGDPVFLSKTAGSLTNDVSSFGSGDVIKKVGHIEDTLSYNPLGPSYTMNIQYQPELALYIP